MIEHTDHKHHDEINRLVTGPLTRTGAPTARHVDPETGLQPPPWWSGDDDASHSSLLARAQAPPLGR